ncbi:hypothetical protein ACFPN4_08925 [Ureibacillus thermophilus]
MMAKIFVALLVLGILYFSTFVVSVIALFVGTFEWIPFIMLCYCSLFAVYSYLIPLFYNKEKEMLVCSHLLYYFSGKFDLVDL